MLSWIRNLHTCQQRAPAAAVHSGWPWAPPQADRNSPRGAQSPPLAPPLWCSRVGSTLLPCSFATGWDC